VRNYVAEKLKQILIRRLKLKEPQFPLKAGAVFLAAHLANLRRQKSPPAPADDLGRAWTRNSGGISEGGVGMLLA